jgi:hypothetical protein
LITPLGRTNKNKGKDGNESTNLMECIQVMMLKSQKNEDNMQNFLMAMQQQNQNFTQQMQQSQNFIQNMMMMQMMGSQPGRPGGNQTNPMMQMMMAGGGGTQPNPMIQMMMATQQSSNAAIGTPTMTQNATNNDGITLDENLYDNNPEYNN